MKYKINAKKANQKYLNCVAN